MTTNPSAQTMIDLAREYEAGLQKCAASGYEEYGPHFQQRQQLVIDALRFTARSASAPAEGAGLPSSLSVTPDSVRAAIENLGYDLKLREFAPRTDIGIRNFNERCEGLAGALSKNISAPAEGREALEACRAFEECAAIAGAHDWCGGGAVVCGDAIARRIRALASEWRANGMGF